MQVCGACRLRFRRNGRKCDACSYAMGATDDGTCSKCNVATHTVSHLPGCYPDLRYGGGNSGSGSGSGSGYGGGGGYGHCNTLYMYLCFGGGSEDRRSGG